MDNITFILKRIVWGLAILSLFSSVSTELFAEAYSPFLTKAFKALDRYVKSCDSWDIIEFQNCIEEASESGDPEAQYQYYRFCVDKHYKGYYWPDIVLSDSLGIEYLKQSCAKGNLNALGEMGILLKTGEKKWDIEENRLKAFEYLKAAQKTDNHKYVKALGIMYIERAESIASSYQEALSCFDRLENIGGNKWDIIPWKFQIFYRTNEYSKAYPLAKQWFGEYRKQINYNKELNLKKIDIKFVNPTWIDCIHAVEVFIALDKSSDLKYIPIFDGSFDYYYPEIDLNFKIWNDDNVFHKYKMLDMIEDYYINNYNDPNYLKRVKSLKFFYTLDPSPDKDHCFSRSRYYKYIHDYDNEIHILYQGVNKGDFSSILQLALYYYYGTEHISVDKNRSFELLKDIKENMSYIGYNRLDYAKACYLLGMMYYTKDIDGFDYKKSVEYLNEFLRVGKGSSDNAIGKVYSLLSKCYRYGRGVEADSSKADRYYSLAVKYGNEDETDIQRWLNSLSKEEPAEK